MRRLIGYGAAAALLIALAAPVPSEAGGHVYFGFTVPLWVGPGWWGPPSYASPTPPVIIQSPPVFAQPETAPASQASAYWYYCPNPQGYYPYVQQCPTGWMQVVPPTTPAR